MLSELSQKAALFIRYVLVLKTLLPIVTKYLTQSSNDNQNPKVNYVCF